MIALQRSISAVLAALLFTALLAAAAPEREPDITIKPRQNTELAANRALLPQELDLETAQRIALSNNPSLRAAAEAVNQANQKIKQARSAWFPQLSTTAAASRTRLDKNTFEQQQQVTALLQRQGRETSQQQQFVEDLSQLPGLSSTAQTIQIFTEVLTPDEDAKRTFTDYSLSLSAQWSLFDGLSRKFTHLATRHAGREAEAGYRDAMRLLMDGVARAYYTAVLSRENMRVTRADEEFQRRLHKEAQARYRAGQAALSDELNFEVRANLSRTRVIESELNFDTAMIALARLMGMPEGRFPEGIALAPLNVEKPEDLEMPGAEGLIDYAINHRPDLVQGMWGADRKSAAAKAWRGELFPVIGISATESAVSRDSASIGPDDFTATISFGLTWDIFTGGRNLARWREAKAGARQAQYELAQTEIDALSEVHTALKNLKAAREQIRLQRKNVVLVRENRNMVEKAYGVGQVSLVRLNEAQRDLLQAEVQLALARVGLKQAWHDLRTATGETLERIGEENGLRPGT
jgi:outer membrane protein TolC